MLRSWGWYWEGDSGRSSSPGWNHVGLHPAFYSGAWLHAAGTMAASFRTALSWRDREGVFGEVFVRGCTEIAAVVGCTTRLAPGGGAGNAIDSDDSVATGRPTEREGWRAPAAKERWLAVSSFRSSGPAPAPEQKRESTLGQLVQATMDWTVPVLSAKRSVFTPNRLSWVSQRLARGVPCAQWTCFPRLREPPPPPATTTGRSLYW